MGLSRVWVWRECVCRGKAVLPRASEVRCKVWQWQYWGRVWLDWHWVWLDWGRGRLDWDKGCMDWAKV